MGPVILLLVTSLVTLVTGQIIRFPIASSSVVITPSDISVAALVVAFLIYSLIFKKSLRINVQIIFPLTLFLLLAAASTILAANTFLLGEVAVGSLFLLRFILYLLVAVVVANVVQKKQILAWLNLFLAIVVVYLLLGAMQMIILPDLSPLTAFGWDPHQKRLVSTFLDPNFAGLFLTFALAIALSLYLYSRKARYLLLSLATFMAIILTFSRSSYLAALFALAVIGVFKSPKITIGFLLIFALSYTLIGRVQQRVIGAANLDETASSRLESYSKAISIFAKAPLFGVGFNTYRFAQSRYGYFDLDNPQGGHAGSGSDSSLLLVLATTGIFGFSCFLFAIMAILKSFIKNVRTSPLNLAATASLVGLLVHSQFVNSFFFPQIMLPFWFIVGLINVADT